jgi:hypothetical protein
MQQQQKSRRKNHPFINDTFSNIFKLVQYDFHENSIISNSTACTTSINKREREKKGICLFKLYAKKYKMN